MDPYRAQRAALGRALRRARRDRDLSQDELALRAGLTPQQVSAIERARRDPRVSTLLKLAAALGLSPSELATMWQQALRSKEPPAGR